VLIIQTENFMKQILLALLMLSCVLHADKIYYTNGKVLENITIQKETYNVVEYSIDSSIREASTTSIQRIEYEDTSSDYIQARSLWREREYAKAIKKYQELQKNTSEKHWSSPYILYFQGKIYQEWGNSEQDTQKYTQAIEIFETFLQIFPESRFVPDAYFSIIECALVMNDKKRMNDSIYNVTKIIDKIKNNEELSYKLDILNGNIAQYNQSYDEAIRFYEQADKTAKKSKLSNLEAISSKAECYLKQEKYRYAEEFWHTQSKNADQENYELQATIKNGLAYCAFFQKDYNKARQLALETFLFIPQAIHQQDFTLYILAESYQNLTEEQDFQKKSKVYKKMLTIAYPHSSWTMKIEKK